MIKDKTEIYYLGNNNSIRYFSYYKTQNIKKISIKMLHSNKGTDKGKLRGRPQ